MGVAARCPPAAAADGGDGQGAHKGRPYRVGGLDGDFCRSDGRMNR